MDREVRMVDIASCASHDVSSELNDTRILSIRLAESLTVGKVAMITATAVSLTSLLESERAVTDSRIVEIGSFVVASTDMFYGAFKNEKISE